MYVPVCFCFPKTSVTSKDSNYLLCKGWYRILPVSKSSVPKTETMYSEKLPFCKSKNLQISFSLRKTGTNVALW